MTVETAPGQSIVAAFKAARRVSVPLVALRTNDPAATIKGITDGALTGKPVIKWDGLTGFSPVNAEGQQALPTILGGTPVEATANEIEALSLLRRAPANTAVFFQNAHLYWKTAQTIQGIWNLRDLFKANYRTLVLLTPDGAALPVELNADVVTIDEPLPDQDRLAAVVQSIYTSVGQTADADTIEKAVDALAGVRSAFTAEQATAMCMTKKGVDIPALWEQKRALINETPGLTYMDPTLSFDDLGGVDALKTFFKLLFEGAAPPSVIVFMDEIDDMFAGVGGDSSGVSTAIHGKFLTHMVRSKAKGAILMGHPGVGKSAIVEAAAKEFGVPLIGLDFGDAKDKHVGESEARVSQVLKTIDAISFGRALYVGTCNSVGNLSAQLLRRFPWRFFFDLPTTAERKFIWPVYAKRPYSDETVTADPLTAAQLKARPDDADWTGAEIKECCEYAWRFNCTLKDAANYVVPIAQSAPEAINKRRREAASRYLSASYAGKYKLPTEEVPVIELPPSAVRAMADMKES